jgi:hypothetical protein
VFVICTILDAAACRREDPKTVSVVGGVRLMRFEVRTGEVLIELAPASLPSLPKVPKRRGLGVSCPPWQSSTRKFRVSIHTSRLLDISTRNSRCCALMDDCSISLLARSTLPYSYFPFFIFEASSISTSNPSVGEFT